MAQIITNNSGGGGKGEKYIAGQDIAISGGLQTDTGSGSVSVSGAISLDGVIAYGGAVQNGTPTPTNPVDIECNNGVLKVNNGVVYADGTQETISDGTNTANAEMLLAISSDRDEQNIINGKITRKVKALVLDGTEGWTLTSSPLGNIFKADILDDNMFSWLICTHFKNGSPLEDNIVYKSAGLPTLQIRYDTATSVEEFIQFLENENTNGTPVIVLYSLNTPTKESVAGQTLALTDGDGTFTITDAQITPLNIGVSYRIPGNIIDFTNETGYITEEDIAQAGYITKDVDDLTNYTKTSDLPDFSTYQLKSNMVTSLNSADNDHYPTAKAVKDAISSAGGGDVSGPASATDGHLAVFDGATGKLIKDGGAIPTPTTVVDDLTTQSATSALSANQGYVLDGKISAINGKIPSAATSSNQLADKQFVNDSINSVTAYYITKDAAGNQFATYAELAAATTFYSGGVVRVPTRNDYTIVLADETHDNSVTRYIYNSGWEYQYTINESPLTQAQLDAINSGITSGKVSTYDGLVSTIAGYGDIVTHNASEFATSAQGTKADTALQPNDNISELSNDVGYITGVNWGDIDGTLSDQVDLQNALNAKANDSGVVHTTGAETINGTKTFGTSPVVPNKTADATNTGTAIATEAQVYKKQDTLVSGTNIKTVNSNSLLGSGNISLNEVPSGGTEGQVLTQTAGGTPTWQDPQGGASGKYINLLLVGGGGGPGFLGGGGGGGVIYREYFYLQDTSIPVVVGGGGACSNIRGCSGGNSSFGKIIAYGGGGGGGNGCSGGNGGNGGGGGCGGCPGALGGYGVPGQGFGGGAGCNSNCGGGGGGAGGPGHEADGCLGISKSLGGCPAAVKYPDGTWCCYGGGGHGKGYASMSDYYFQNCYGYGGWVGASYLNCGTGGVAMICYPTDGSYGFTCATGGTVTTCCGYKIHTFTSNGTFTIVS